MKEEIGMTNEQYKGQLLDQLEYWHEVLKLASESHDEKVIKKLSSRLIKSTRNLNSSKRLKRWRSVK